MFDYYSLKARYYPMVLLLLPIAIIGAFYSVEFQSLIQLFSSLGIVGALTYLFSQLGRDQGKKKEAKLWGEWGGMPSVQLLRLNDSRIDKNTKQRYHQKLQQGVPVAIIPDQVMETNNPAEADDIYKAWTKFLISKTRDSKTFSLLLKDNTSYGFRRNLWGLKTIAIIFIIAAIIGNFIYWKIKIPLWNLVDYPRVFIYSTAVLILLLLLWIIIVTKNWIKIPAFSYAERLLETIEVIP